MNTVSDTLHVHVTGDGIDGDYVIADLRPDGQLLLRPDDSAAAMRERHGLTPATLAELEAELGPVGPPDGEG